MLSSEESSELNMIVDRLSVQNPEGESLKSYLQSLRSMLTGREKLAAALIERVSRSPSLVGFRTFEELKGLVENREYRRIIKQAAYRFSQKGFSVDAGPQEVRPVVLIPKEARTPESHMIPAGDVSWFVSAYFPGDIQLVPQAVTFLVEHHFRDVSVRVVESSHRLYREFLHKLEGQIPNKPFEIPIRHAARLYFETLDFLGKEDLSADSERARRLFQPFYDPKERSHAYRVMPVLDNPEERIREVDIRALFDRLGPSMPLFAEEDLLPYVEKMRDMEQSVLVVSPEIQRERGEYVLTRAADALYTGRMRPLCRRFFEEQALILKNAGEEALAMSSWITAQHLASVSEGGQSPVVVGMVVLSMRVYWPEDFEKGDAESGPFRETDSGLFVPH